MIICCPACGFRGRVPEGKDGRDKKRVICPSCGHRFSVGLVVVPSGDQPPGHSGSVPRADGATVGGPISGGVDTAQPYRDGKKKKRRPFLWGCLIAVAALAIGIAIFFLINGISRQVQESKESDILKKLGEKYPGYLLLNSIAIDPGSMTELQITSYQKGLVGKGCVGMGTVANIEKTMGSTVLDFFGLTAPGTIITLTHKGYDVELLLDESYSDEFLSYGVGDTVLFAGTIKKAVIGRRTRVALVDVIIEGHRKGEAGSHPPEIKRSLTKRLIELLLQ
jgi:hypothetical protein